MGMRLLAIVAVPWLIRIDGILDEDRKPSSLDAGNKFFFVRIRI